MKLLSYLFVILTLPVYAFADITYSLHLDGVDSGIANQITNSIQEAVELYNKYGSFNKHLNVYYNSGVPTAQASYNGTIEFGNSRNTRVALHEMGHTLGVGQHSNYWNNMVNGVWQGYYGRTFALDTEGGYDNGLHGDSVHIWPWGLNYDTEDSAIERINHIRVMAAIRCDMDIMSFAKEASDQIVSAGEMAVFSVASPTADSYRWYKDGNILSNSTKYSGVTTASLKITNASLEDEGNYYCRATGSEETLNSRPAILMIKKNVGRWNFQNNVNDSVNNFDGTAYGSPTYTTGIDGSALNFDGNNDYVALPADVARSNNITVAAFVYWNGGNQWQRIFDFGNNTSQYLFLTPRSGGNTLRFAIKNGSSEQYIETTQLRTGSWTHVAVTLNGDVATLYVNGAVVATSADFTIDPTDFSPVNNYIGNSQWPDPMFNGRIDSFCIYNYALSGDEIWNLYGRSTNSAPTFTTDIISLPAVSVNDSISALMLNLSDYVEEADGHSLTFSKVSGPSWLRVYSNGSLTGNPGSANRGDNSFTIRVRDSYGATDDVTMKLVVYGQPDTRYLFDNSVIDSSGTNNASASGGPAYASGIQSNAIRLDGSNDYLTLPANVIDTSDFTISTWVRWYGGNQWQRIFDFGNDKSEYMFLTPLSGNNTLRFAITATGGESQEQRIETSSLATNRWVHIAITLNGDTGKMYVDGALVDVNNAMTIDPVDFNPGLNYIGKSQYSDPYFNGLIDEFRIYKYAMTDDEIAMLSDIPRFTSDPVNADSGIELIQYNGSTLADYVVSDISVQLLFSKVSGSSWLDIDENGNLSGMPEDSDVGENRFNVQVQNLAGMYDNAGLIINVANIYSGAQGLEDLAGLSMQWLQEDCIDCGGADLDGDSNVNLSDFSILAGNWMK